MEEPISRTEADGALIIIFFNRPTMKPKAKIGFTIFRAVKMHKSCHLIQPG
jgi:hypothetical protein